MKNFLDVKELNSCIEEVALTKERDKPPKTSVIIVCYNPDTDLFRKNFESLMKDVETDYEILVVDNSDQAYIKDYVTALNVNYIKLKRNYGLTTGRNVGILHARGDILIFLDDDAIPGKKYIDQHTRAYVENNICALRGKCVPRTNATINHLALHYDLGEQKIPYYINLEGNSSFKKEILFKVGGFNSELQGAGGHEGLEISKKIIDITKDINSVIYWPYAVIHHDYSKSLIHYLKKQIRHQDNIEKLRSTHTEFLDLYSSYNEAIKQDKKKPGLVTRVKIRIIRKINEHAIRPNSITNRIVKSF